MSSATHIVPKRMPGLGLTGIKPICVLNNPDISAIGDIAWFI